MLAKLWASICEVDTFMLLDHQANSSQLAVFLIVRLQWNRILNEDAAAFNINWISIIQLFANFILDRIKSLRINQMHSTILSVERLSYVIESRWAKCFNTLGLMKLSLRARFHNVCGHHRWPEVSLDRPLCPTEFRCRSTGFHLCSQLSTGPVQPSRIQLQNILQNFYFEFAYLHLLVANQSFSWALVETYWYISSQLMSEFAKMKKGTELFCTGRNLLSESKQTNVVLFVVRSLSQLAIIYSRRCCSALGWVCCRTSILLVVSVFPISGPTFERR